MRELRHLLRSRKNSDSPPSESAWKAAGKFGFENRLSLAHTVHHVCTPRLWSKIRHGIALLFANSRRRPHFGDKVLREGVGRHHHTITMQKLCLPFPTSVLHGQMIKTARNKIGTSTHKKRKRWGLGWDSRDQAEGLQHWFLLCHWPAVGP